MRAAGSTGPSREARALVFREFLSALEPLRAAGKLGGILFQLPPYVVPKPAVVRLPRVGARRSSAATRCSSSSATATGSPRSRRAEMLGWLEERRMSLRDASTRRASTRANVPQTLVAVTGPLAYVRFHGRNAGDLEQARRRRGRSASTTSTAATSSPAGSSRCASSRAPPSRPSPSSTTTTRPTGSRRPRPGPSCCAACSKTSTSRSAEPATRVAPRHGAASVAACASSRSPTAPLVRSELFGEVIRRGGPRARRVGDRHGPDGPRATFDAVLVLGGHMNVGEEARAPVARGRVRAAARAASPRGRRSSRSASAPRRSPTPSAPGSSRSPHARRGSSRSR